MAACRTGTHTTHNKLNARPRTVGRFLPDGRNQAIVQALVVIFCLEQFRFGADCDLVYELFDFGWSLGWRRGFPQGPSRTSINPT